MRLTSNFCLALAFFFPAVLAAAFEDEPKQPAVTVTEKDAGGKVSVPAQGEVVIQLPGEGRGGRVWRLAKHDPAQLEPIVKKPELVPGPKEKDLGQTLHAIFRFKALKSGDVELHYVLPAGAGEKPTKPEKEFKVRVEVRPAQ